MVRAYYERDGKMHSTSIMAVDELTASFHNRESADTSVHVKNFTAQWDRYPELREDMLRPAIPAHVPPSSRKAVISLIRGLCGRSDVELPDWAQ